MKNFHNLLSLVFGLVFAGTAFAGPATICQGGVPYARVDLYIAPLDKGRPCIVYVGSHDPDQTAAEFYYDNRWQAWDSILYPPNQVFRNGINDMTLYIPLDRVVEKLGWKLYVGYGVLTEESEQKVQRMILSYQRAKAKLPDRQIPTVEPDHYRRVLVQTDMLDNAKYRHVLDWTSDLIGECSSSN
jgi:hypothetical protein